MTWRRQLTPDEVGWLVVFAFFAAFGLMCWTLIGCTRQQANTARDQETCLGKADAWLHAQILERCNTPTYEACPEHDYLNAEWTRRAKLCR